MSNHLINYDNLADQYDRSRTLSPVNEVLWLDLFKQHLGLDKTSRVLDIGCGTGRFSILIAQQFRCAVVGIDPSFSMLTKGKVKCLNDQVTWLRTRGEAIPFSEGIFDVCFASQVIHHFDDQLRAFVEMHRVLRHGGRIGIRISSHAQLKTILDYRFFPSALQIDRKRLPDIQTVRGLMQTVGFSIEAQKDVRQQLFESADDYLAKLGDKYSSVLSLISEEEYRKGLEKAAVYLGDGEFKPSDQYAEITFLVGVK
jgi:ubiquinone/menaquinone biosynthesis C-methylase UbiE